jgi:hypothetical protein
MNRIVVDDFVKAEFLRAEEPCDVVDASGNKLGKFTPQYVGYECHLTMQNWTRSSVRVVVVH